MPDDYKLITPQDAAQINQAPHSSPHMPVQEKGTRSSCALPYELYADGSLDTDKKMFEIHFTAANEVFGKSATGSPFMVYAPGIYREEAAKSWNYALTAGDKLKDDWAIENFENGNYHLRVHGPNGFYREFKGSSNDPLIEVKAIYERSKINTKKLTGNIVLQVKNKSTQSLTVNVKDESYKTGVHTKTIAAGALTNLSLDLSQSHHWYDFSVDVKGHENFTKRYAGRVETGNAGITDPLMGAL